MPALEFIARTRPEPVGDQAVVALRWQARQPLGAPDGGFTLARDIDGAVVNLFVERNLPGASQDVGTGKWSIDAARLRTDADARRTLAGGAEVGVPVPSWDQVEPLIPLLTFALGDPSPDELERMLEGLAELRGNAHRSDPELTFEHWQHARYHQAPPIDAIRAMRASGDPDENALYEAVISFYRRDATNFLLVRAEHFGFAKLLGWGFDDLFDPGVDPDAARLSYHVTANFTPAITSDAQPLPADAPFPAPPIDLAEAAVADFEVTPREGLVGYPPFAPLFSGPTRWLPSPPASAATLPKDQTTLLAELTKAAEKGPCEYPTPVARLRWSAPPAAPPDGEHDRDGDHRRRKPELLDLSARFWRVEAHSFGPDSAMADPPAPQLPVPPQFKTCPEGEHLRARPVNLFVHGVDLPWGELPLEGWYAYRVRGVDLFGVDGPGSGEVSLRMRDATPPPPPSVRTEHPSIVLDQAGRDLEVVLGWDAYREYRAPDRHEYRLAQHWTELVHVPVVVAELSAASAEFDAVRVLVRLTHGGSSLDAATLAHAPGGTLFTTDGEFAIVGPGPAGTDFLDLRRADGRAPPLQGAAMLRHAKPETREDCGVMAPVKALPARAQLISLEPFAVALTEVARARAIAPVDGRLHLHLLGDSFPAAPDGGNLSLGRGERSQSADAIDALKALPFAEAAAWLEGSPALLLARQTQVLRLTPPASYVVGSLRIGVTSADAAPYVVVAGKIGNESGEADCLLTATDPTPPSVIALRPPKVWARGATEYLDTAEAELQWPSVDRAVRYEIERALEPRLGGGGASDDALLEIASAAEAEETFQRVSSHVFDAAWTDALPGRVPTRAVYRARAVSGAGIPNPTWTTIALVRVPDVRIAAPPNLLLVEPIRDQERTLRLAWTQAGPLAGLGFQVEGRPAADAAEPDSDWGVLADFEPNMLEVGPGQRFETIAVNVTPGLLHQVRVRAVRHALDPHDRLAKLTRRIDGRVSLVMEARASGTLIPPRDLRHRVSAGRVTIEWRNVDRYAEIELRRRAPGKFGFERIPVTPSAERFEERQTLAPGKWVYELGVSGPGAYSRSARIVVDIEASAT